jgi:hypothetical protein
MTARSRVLERAVVCFACASAGLGLFSAFAVGMLVVLLGDNIGIVLEVVGPRRTVWWLGALGAWFVLAGLLGLALWRRERSRSASSCPVQPPEGIEGA